MQEEQKPDAQEPESNWQVTTGDDLNDAQYNNATPELAENISWSASEYISHDKDQRWYAFVGLAVVGMAILVFLFDSSHGWFSPLMIVAAGGIFIASASRKPRVLEYSIDSSGLHIGGKAYAFASFKSFSVIEEGAIDSIMLIPLQRFSPSLTIYFEPKDEQKIAEALGTYLAHEDRQQDPIDRLMRKIRF